MRPTELLKITDSVMGKPESNPPLTVPKPIIQTVLPYRLIKTNIGGLERVDQH